MRNLKLATLSFAFFHSLILCSCNNTGKPGDRKEEDQKQESAENTNIPATEKQPGNNQDTTELDFLKTLDGKYPIEVKLFDNAAFTERLKKLLGDDRYDFLKEKWAVETPMEFKNEVFVASGCQAHKCGSTNFIVVYDFTGNVMNAGIREEDKVKIYTENNSESPKINEWAKGN